MPYSSVQTAGDRRERHMRYYSIDDYIDLSQTATYRTVQPHHDNLRWQQYVLVTVRGINYYYYLCQVNEVNGGDNVFVRCGSVRLSVCLCAAEQSIRPTVKATDFKFKFDMDFPRDSPDMTP